jgi:putative redox protein
MKTSLDLNWTGNMSFETEMNGHKVILDADPTVGGENKGIRPKPLMLLALAGCTGMDVDSMLKKMRFEPEDLKITIEANMTEDHPKHYNKMHVIYTFKGKNLPMEKLQKVVNLSEEKYCGVSEVYKKAMEITNEIRIEE